MSFSHLTIKERYQIEAYVLEGHSVRKIASLMKVHPFTISRELKRSPGQYFAERAEAHASLCRSTKGRRTTFTISIFKTMEPRGKFLIGTPISDRPPKVETQKTFGHWEIDTVVPPRGKDKACVVPFLELKTRFYVTIRMPDCSATSM